MYMNYASLVGNYVRDLIQYHNYIAIFVGATLVIRFPVQVIMTLDQVTMYIICITHYMYMYNRLHV